MNEMVRQGNMARNCRLVSIPSTARNQTTPAQPQSLSEAHILSTSFPMVGKRTLTHWRSKGDGLTKTARESRLALCVAASSSIHAENRHSWPQLTKSNCPAIPLNLSFCWLHGCHWNLFLPLVPYLHTAYGLGMLRKNQTVCVCLSMWVCGCV